jgi:hypothetical protein
MSGSVLASFQEDSQTKISSICTFCERILVFNGKSTILPHQPDIVSLGCSARSCCLCKFINKHLLASARREIGRLWLKKLRNSELGESSSLTVSIRLASQIPCFRVSWSAGPRVVHTPDICIGSLWTLGTFESLLVSVQVTDDVEQVDLLHDQFGIVLIARQLSLDFPQ